MFSFTSHDDLFTTFRLTYVLFGLLAALALWRRPRPIEALAFIVGANLAAWAVYVAPLGRLYALNEMADVSFNVGSAACAAATGNPWDHTQVRFAHLEPFWSGLLALLSFGHPERVLPLYAWLSPLSIVGVALGLYFGLASPEDDDGDRWERVLIVLAVLGLSSWSQTQRPPIPALWAGNFLLKPNHAMSWGLAGIALGLVARRVRPWISGLVLAVMAWVFILDWAFLAAGLVLGTFLRRDAVRRDWISLAQALGLSLLLTLPYIRHLMRDHDPTAHGGTPDQMWLDVLGQLLRPPEWATLDLGLLFLLGLVGAIFLTHRRTARDAMLLGLLGATWAAWLGYQVGARFGITPEADEHHYFLRIAMALAAGAALAAIGRHVESWRGLGPGRGAVLAFAAAWPLTFPAYWNPPSMDRYFRYNLDPVPVRVQQYAHWIRENTPRDAVFLAGRQSGTWIPVLAGRRILLASDARPPADYEGRKEAERVLLRSGDARLIAETARRYGVTHLAIDEPMTEEYGADALKGIGRVPGYEVVFANKLVRILAIRPVGAALTSAEATGRSSASP
jgi:hypothetical protein